MNSGEINKSINRPNLHIAPYKIWTAVLNNVKIWGVQ